MSYNYEVEKVELLKPDNVAKILKAATSIKAAIKNTGAITYHHAMSHTGFSDSWQMMACLDYLVEQQIFGKVRWADPGQCQILRELT